MYDTSFDAPAAEVPRSDRKALWGLRIAALLAAILAASADAQMPGAPILQNAWATPGMVAAINLGGGPDGSMYAAAGAWSPGSGRFQLSGGLGVQSRSAGQGTGGVYGVRAAIPLSSASSTVGFAVFAGIGGGGSSKTVSPTLPTDSSKMSTGEIPIGAAIGWRHAIGTAHGVSVYGAPSYVYFTGGSKTGGLIRTSLGVDVGITPTLGATAGLEFGGTRARVLGGPSGTRYGFGLSYALGRR